MFVVRIHEQEHSKIDYRFNTQTEAVTVDFGKFYLKKTFIKIGFAAIQQKHDFSQETR